MSRLGVASARAGWFPLGARGTSSKLQWLWMAAHRNVPAEELGRFGVEILMGDKTATWIGNFGVFGWYRNSPGAPQVVVRALMALEKWLYDTMDAGEGVDGAVQQICQENQPLALAGVLIVAGLSPASLREF